MTLSTHARHYSDKGPCDQTSLSLTSRGIYREKYLEDRKDSQNTNLEELGMRRINKYI